MIRTDWQPEIFRMRLEEGYDHYQGKRLSQCEAASLLGIPDRTVRRSLNHYDEDGLDING